VRGFVYVLQMEGHPWLKIGRTTNRIDGARDRLSTMQVGCPITLHLVREYPCESPETMEWVVHKMLAQERRRGEWFETTLERIDAAIALAHDDPTCCMNTEERARYETSLRIQQEIRAGVAEQDRKEAEQVCRAREKAHKLSVARAAQRVQREAEEDAAARTRAAERNRLSARLSLQRRSMLVRVWQCSIGGVCLCLSAMLCGMARAGLVVLRTVVTAEELFRRWYRESL
jgi:Meiotically up-regulated gene 113